MNRSLISLIVLAGAFAARPAHAQQYVDPNLGDVFALNWKCVHGNGTPCTSQDLASPWYRQVLVMPTGFEEQDRGAFFADFDTLVRGLGASGNAWSAQKRDQLLYVGYFVASDPLGPTAAFGGYVAAHPVRGYALSLHNDAVYAKVESIRTSELPALRPLAVAVLYNTFAPDITDNATPASMTGRSYGVAKLTRGDVPSPYIGPHELGHASLNFLDEYVEKGFESLNVHSLDIATPLIDFDGTWSGALQSIGNLFGVYDYNISEILAANGNANISLSSMPSTVSSPGQAQSYPYEGGLLFGRGTYHMAGSNLMNNDYVMRAGDDAFAYAHSPEQQQIIETAFGGTAGRANDRLRNAGPINGWPLVFGSTTHVMLYDGDKNNEFHPTQYYVVQLGWWERKWYIVWAGFVPYWTYVDVWKTAQKNVYPTARYVDIKATSLYGFANLMQVVMCSVGVTEVDGVKTCEQSFSEMSYSALPTFKLKTPYEETDVPASQWFTTYWWRFSTWNGTKQSGWTGWSSFYRSF
ncbi:MAG TPA: hypothetical protein VIV40_41025 [Kofleriaceae bacterium]